MPSFLFLFLLKRIISEGKIRIQLKIIVKNIFISLFHYEMLRNKFIYIKITASLPLYICPEIHNTLLANS